MLTEEELYRTAGLMNVLGNPTRMRIVLLVGETRRPLHIKAVAKVLGKDYAAVYRHIKMLQKSDLLEIYDVGRSRVISLKRKNAIQELIEFAKILMSKSE
jgi:DNA-binding transcriptional ArsR family regulator